MNNQILEAINLANLGTGLPLNEKEAYLTEAQNILLKYLADNPKDTQAWLLLTRTECNSPFYDPARIVEYTNAILSYDNGNVYALLFLSYADYYLMGNQDESLYNKLLLAQSDDHALLSMIEIAKARSCQFRDVKLYEECLLKSISYCNTSVTNYTMLGELYLEKNRRAEGVFFIKNGLANIRKVVTPENAVAHSAIDMHNFFNEFFIGTVIIFLEYNRLCALIDDVPNK